MSTALITTRDWEELGQCLTIPLSAFTLDGFRKWYLSGACPDHLKVSYLGGDIYIEHLVDDQMVVAPRKAATLDGFIEWAESPEFPERGRISFLGSRIFIDMSPEEIETHNKVKGTISNVVSTFTTREDLGEFYFDRTLVVNRRARLSTEPDGAFALWESRKSGRVRKIPRRDRQGEYTRIEGTPDWILEVVSRSSFVKDTQTHPEKFYRARVTEFWLVDATGEDVDFQILAWTETGYTAAPVRKGWHYSPLFKRYFRLKRTRSQLGDWQYELQTRKSVP